MVCCPRVYRSWEDGDDISIPKPRFEKRVCQKGRSSHMPKAIGRPMVLPLVPSLWPKDESLSLFHLYSSKPSLLLFFPKGLSHLLPAMNFSPLPKSFIVKWQ